MTSITTRTCPWARSLRTMASPRQGVRDVIVRAEAILTELEVKPGLIKRFHTMHSQLEQLRQDAQQLVELAAQRDQADMELLALRVRDTADQLLKE